jgi:PhzF family phenazine biosynthesis protein
MPTLPLYQVDAFTERPFGGNPAAVCPLQAAIPEALMQDIAAENNLSETAFFLYPGTLAGSRAPRDELALARRENPQGDAFSLRWFTPTVEVELCGHATLASAFVLFTELEPARRDVTFRTRGGLLSVRRGDGGELVMDFPTLPMAPAGTDTRAGVEAALGTKVVDVLASPTRLLAVQATAEDVRRASPDLAAVARTGASLCITAPGDGDRIDFVSRYFAPASGIAEDPVTGSAHCMLTPYWAARLGKPTLRARQLSRRGGDITCQLRGDRVLLGGKARLVIRGTFVY